jgi:IS605 OrfB family transposase
MSEKSEKRIVKVAKFQILKPAPGMEWKQLAELLRSVRYRVFRLANLCISEAYLEFYLWRIGQSDKIKVRKISALNKELRKMLVEEKNKDEHERFSKEGALPATIVDALSQYKSRALTGKSKWSEVIRGKAALPTFRSDMAIPICCHKPSNRRLIKLDSGDVEIELMVYMKPYPKIILKTEKLSGSMKSILERLLDNLNQSMEGYRQRCFEVRQDRNNGRIWWLHITYDFPRSELELNKEKVVGVDVGFACPLYASISNGLARLGWRHFQSLAKRIRILQSQISSRRRSIQSGGKNELTKDTARGGHGRKRRLKPIENLAGRIDKAYMTLNHQLSRSVIDFAKDQGAGVIQMEALDGLKDELSGTFLGSRWRYFELQNFIGYKAKEAGIEVRYVNPRYTSRRCSECGFINMEFTREYRDAHRENGKTAMFKCPQCEGKMKTSEKEYKGLDPDYNAARNLAVLDIEDRIRQQCVKQNIPLKKDEDFVDL